MAIPASGSKTLDTSDYNEVALECQSVSARWRDLGTRLGLLPHTMNSIEATHRGDVGRCLQAVIEKWLQRPMGEVLESVLPTWKNLCEALSYIDRSLADRIAKEHDCGDITESDTSKLKAEQKVVAEKTGVQTSFVTTTKPTTLELDECLKDLVAWERFALRLSGIQQRDIDIIKRNNRDDVVNQMLALYEKWLRVFPSASWDDVVQALEKVEENAIASKIRAKFRLMS